MATFFQLQLKVLDALFFKRCSYVNFFKKLVLITFIQQEWIQFIKRDSKTFIMLQKISVLNKCCSCELSIHQRRLNKCITVSTKILASTTVFNQIIRNVC